MHTPIGCPRKRDRLRKREAQRPDFACGQSAGLTAVSINEREMGKMVSLRFRSIRTEEEYEAALARLDEIFDAEAGSAEDEELDDLADLVESYEDKHYPIGMPDPVSAIEFRMDQAGLSQRDLIPYIGSSAKVAEVLSGKREITLSMARALHEHLGIPADALLQRPAAETDFTSDEIDPRRVSIEGDGEARPDSQTFR